MMSWASKLSYPPDATRTVSVRATTYQGGRWQEAAKLRGMATAGAFLAWAGDMLLAMQHAYEDANHDHYDALHPASAGEEGQRREERAQERERRMAG